MDRIILATSSGVVYGDRTTSTEENNQPEAVRISVSPNPFANGVELSLFFKENSEFSDLEIFNVRGERVRRLNYPHINNRELTLFWDGKDDEGRVVPSGVYFYRVGNDRSRGVGKMVKIK
ncbi:MAG: FlgD immunoglobulin-like domain containing protein [Candidatus Zophobacter franzmannii]|nr:FlgD immunoglobulin-like domain containing protein [Candidatus Zophobacter franzmannii]